MTSSSARARLALAASSLLALGSALGLGDVPRDPFRQLEEILPTPGPTRAASGAPGHAYWQQRVDYVIEAALDDEHQRIEGQERITYHNNSPDELAYLWLQVDPNIFAPESHARTTAEAPDLESESYEGLARLLDRDQFDGGAKIAGVRDAAGRPLPFVVNDTMMRVDLPQPLASGASLAFSVAWSYAINDQRRHGGRTGYELFEADGNYLYEIAQWFPRLCAYTDVNGWQNKQYLGRGEFTLEFGDYLVRLTVPSDHVVAATGTLQNPEEVLSETQRERLAAAQDAERAVFVVTREEAEANELSNAHDTKTWEFQARNVRDFAWASSRKFLWDAVRYRPAGGEPVWCMSFYPKEAEPLWSRYSTQAIVHTLDVYGAHAFPFPYPTAISVNGPVGGMEYPMISFNGPRPEADGTYSESTKHGLISVVIHEVGHNWFPMVVNSDERQWTWMDEGLNSFLQYLAEQAWDPDYPSGSGEPGQIARYMASEEQVPIMTNSESLLQFGNNAYAKPAAALNVLRETVMGRELFDFAFREYARRWRFKRPEPADFFRTLEDASAVDLDWFWRGWFYTTDHVDLALAGVHLYTLDTQDPDVERARARAEREGRPRTLAQTRNESLPRRTERYPELLDFYDDYDPLAVVPEERKAYLEQMKALDARARELVDAGLFLYVVELENKGGLVAPVVLAATFEDGTARELRAPAEVWRRDPERVKQLLVGASPLVSLTLDPHLETADTDLANNAWPPRIEETRVRLREGGRRGRGRGGDNPMRAAERRKASEADPAGGSDGASGAGGEE